MKKFSVSQLFKALGLLTLLVALPFMMEAAKNAQQLLIRARGVEANLVVDMGLEMGILEPNWNFFAQGGEETTDMLGPVVSEIRALKPRYIRLDHVFDFYEVVTRTPQGSLQFDFTRLNSTIASIRATGALPFISLSYMPTALSGAGITDGPKNWDEWALVVQRLVEQVSGRGGLGLTDVYYEVWNEPDLFGRWNYTGNKNYLTLYEYAARGAAQATDTHPFKIGGPATTRLYKNWIDALATHVTKKNLRLDFISWHLYDEDPTTFAEDSKKVTQWLFRYGNLVVLPRIVTEWGFTPEIHPGYDNKLAAAHAVAVVRQTLQTYDQLYAFEVVDGLDPTNQPRWGRWGLMTHPTHGKELKPRYHAFSLLNQLSGTRVRVEGEGTWVTAIAAKEGTTLRLLITNYDHDSSHAEQIPLTIRGLENDVYLVTETRLGHAPATRTLPTTGGVLEMQIITTANEVVLLEVAPSNAFLRN